MENQKLGYELRIGNDYFYYDTEASLPLPCKLINICHDGDNVVYEFSHHDVGAIGATIYPNKLKEKKIKNCYLKPIDDANFHQTIIVKLQEFVNNFDEMESTPQYMCDNEDEKSFGIMTDNGHGNTMKRFIVTIKDCKTI